MKFILLMFALLFAQTTFASQLRFDARVANHSCSYYSNRTAEVVFKYRNQSLPWGTQLVLHYGLGNSRQEASGENQWNHIRQSAMGAIGEYTWQFKENLVLASRGSSENYDSLNFVVQIQYPNGLVTYDRGSSAAQGYYHVRLVGEPGSLPCIGGSIVPDYKRYPITIVR
jgi:hypothetical protein